MIWCYVSNPHSTDLNRIERSNFHRPFLSKHVTQCLYICHISFLTYIFGKFLTLWRIFTSANWFSLCCDPTKVFTMCNNCFGALDFIIGHFFCKMRQYGTFLSALLFALGEFLRNNIINYTFVNWVSKQHFWYFE